MMETLIIVVMLFASFDRQSLATSAWTQMGAVIDGKAFGDHSGWSEHQYWHVFYVGSRTTVKVFHSKNIEQGRK